MEASAKARLPTGGETSCHPSVIETAKSSGMGAGLGVWRREAAFRGRKASAAGKATAMESTGAVEIVAIDENPAVGDVGAVVEHDPVIRPIVSPVSPAPSETAEEANSKAKAPSEPWPREVQSRIPVPARPDSYGVSIHEPGVVFRNVDNLRVRGLNHNGLPLIAHLLLRRALQVPGLLRTVTHHLNSVHDVLL